MVRCWRGVSEGWGSCDVFVGDREVPANFVQQGLDQKVIAIRVCATDDMGW